MELYAGGIILGGMLRRWNRIRWNHTGGIRDSYFLCPNIHWKKKDPTQVRSILRGANYVLTECFVLDFTPKAAQTMFQRNASCQILHQKGRKLCFNGMLRARFYTKSSANYVSTECFVLDFTPKGAQTMAPKISINGPLLVPKMGRAGGGAGMGAPGEHCAHQTSNFFFVKFGWNVVIDPPPKFVIKKLESKPLPSFLPEIFVVNI